jgi:hypothetical protein
LFENPVTDIEPNTLRIVDKNGVCQFDRIEISEPVIIWQDLGGDEARFQPQIADKFFAEGNPIDLWGGCPESVEVSDRACQLCFKSMSCDLRAAFEEPSQVHSNLFSQSCRHRGLTMGSRQEGKSAVLPGEIL